MTPDPDEAVLVCERVADLRHPSTTSVRRKCSSCRTPVWVMAKNLASGLRLMCHPCGVALMKEVAARGEPVAVLPGRLLPKGEN
jgi:hypothetical protein